MEHTKHRMHENSRSAARSAARYPGRSVRLVRIREQQAEQLRPNLMASIKQSMQVTDWPLDKILPYPGNPRKRSKKSVAKIAASIKEFGPQQPIVVDEKGIILVGHGRRDAAEELGMIYASTCSLAPARSSSLRRPRTAPVTVSKSNRRIAT